MHGDYIQSEIQILAECAFAICRFKVAVCRRNHSHVDFHLVVAADWPYLLLLQDAEKFRLHLQRQFTDLVEKYRAAIRALEESFFALCGARKCAFFIAEQFALDESRH